MQRPKIVKRKLILGITGSFGSGKTTVAKIFASFGAKVIDADKIAHRLIRRRSLSYKKICKIFGDVILKRNKAIDRKKLAAVAFNDSRLLKKLNLIIHPEVIIMIKNKAACFKSGIIVLDVPLLIESGLNTIVDKLIVVRVKKSLQIKRVQAKNRLNKDEIFKRLSFQMPINKKAGFADFIIDNSGTINQTRRKVWKIRRLLWKN